MQNHQKLQWAGVLFVGALAACEDKKERIGPAVGETPAKGTVEDIKAAPLKYVGRTVTVSGEVDRVFGDQGFEIEGDGIIWEKKLLVLTKSPVRFGPTLVRDDDDVIVKGTVRRMAVADLERELGRDLSTDIEQKYADQPVLVADSVRLVETGFRWTEDVRDGTIVSIYRLISEVSPKALAGTNIDLDAMHVHAKSGRGLWIGPSTRTQMFVVPNDASTLAGVAVGDRIDLKGKIRVMPPMNEAAKKFELDPATTARAVDHEIYVEATELSRSTIPPAS